MPGEAAIVLVDAAAAAEVAGTLHDTYRDRCPEHDARFHLVTPSDGVSAER